MHEVWAQFDRTMKEVEKTFRMADAAVQRTSRLPCSASTIPLTWRNRWRLIQLAFSRAKRVRLTPNNVIMQPASASREA